MVCSKRCKPMVCPKTRTKAILHQKIERKYIIQGDEFKWANMCLEKKLIKRIKCQNGHIVRFHNNSVEIKVQYTSNPHKLSLKVHSLVGRANITVPTPSAPWNSPGRWVWWSDQRGSGMPFYWTVYPTCLSETLVFQYTSREIWRQEESYK